jgi:hypothetical protein
MVRNGMIPIAYRRDIRHGRILLGGAFSAWPIAFVGPVAHAYVRMKDSDPYTYKSSFSLTTSPVLLCCNTWTCRCQPYLSLLALLLYNTPTPGRGRAWGVHACSECLHPSRTLYANAALVAPSSHPPRRQRRQTLQPIAQQRQRQRQRLPTARRCHGQKGEYISATVPPHLRAAHIFAIQTTI